MMGTKRHSNVTVGFQSEGLTNTAKNVKENKYKVAIFLHKLSELYARLFID